VSLDALSGKVIYLDFWATWCAPCRISLPWMDALQKKYADSGLVILAVNEDTTSEDALKVWRDLSPAFTALADQGGKVAGMYAPPTMPSSFLIDRKGVLRLIHPGFKEDDQAQLEAEIVKLINEK
jgi:cytochrome c biogenesis protein CcmG/thiol:disulfide interchange protein DsbE